MAGPAPTTSLPMTAWRWRRIGRRRASWEREFRAIEDGVPIGPIYVSSVGLPFEQWRLLTAIPRSDFRRGDRPQHAAGTVRRRRPRPARLGHGAPVRQLAVRPAVPSSCRRSCSQIERFALDQVRHPADLPCGAQRFLVRRSSAWPVGSPPSRRYMPLDVVRPLVAAASSQSPVAKLPRSRCCSPICRASPSRGALGADVEPLFDQLPDACGRRRSTRRAGRSTNSSAMR